MDVMSDGFERLHIPKAERDAMDRADTITLRKLRVPNERGLWFHYDEDTELWFFSSVMRVQEGWAAIHEAEPFLITPQPGIYWYGPIPEPPKESVSAVAGPGDF